MPTPRLFLARHGETPWTLTGQHTSRTDLSLTARGITTTQRSAHILVGRGRHIDPARLAAVFVSPRRRAQETLALLLGPHRALLEAAGKVHTVDELREWEYGAYEGLTPREIRLRRKDEGRDRVGRAWDIWRDGTGEVGGETVVEVGARCDALAERVRELQRGGLKEGMGVDGEGEGEGLDVLCVAHGHILRAFTKRWLGLDMSFPLQMILEPGGIGTLSYNHNSIDEPALVLGPVLAVPDQDAGKTEVDAVVRN